jgi:hypothetical protein
LAPLLASPPCLGVVLEGFVYIRVTNISTLLLCISVKTSLASEDPEFLDDELPIQAHELGLCSTSSLALIPATQRHLPGSSIADH